MLWGLLGKAGLLLSHRLNRHSTSVQVGNALDQQNIWDRVQLSKGWCRYPPENVGLGI